MFQPVAIKSISILSEMRLSSNEVRPQHKASSPNKKAAAKSRCCSSTYHLCRCASDSPPCGNSHDSPASVKCRTSSGNQGISAASASTPSGKNPRSPCSSFRLLMVFAPLSSLSKKRARIIELARLYQTPLLFASGFGY